MSNHKNPAIKRIMADVKELNLHPSHRYYAEPLENNMFEWHFTIRGPPDTPFEGGIYHGRILLPAEYPFKPPNIVFLTKNGRFECGTKICLSISAYHEESWQPAWGVRTMLEAIISFFPSEGAGAIGALDWTPEERKKLAVESRSYCCNLCGPIAKLLSDPPPSDSASAADGPDETILSQISQLQMTQKSSDTSSSPSEKVDNVHSNKSCCECKEASPIQSPAEAVPHPSDSSSDTASTAAVSVPNSTSAPTSSSIPEVVQTAPVEQIGMIRKPDLISDVLYALVVIVIGMLVALSIRIVLKIRVVLWEEQQRIHY